ncbi:MAG: TRAP transporter substrate-binding protein [Alphaproteobacteria bacterium]|nr:TRAP transporter substrate-binding protein [Alphaproteobacteria bacterium]
MTKTIGLTRRALVASTAALGATTLLPRRARAAEFEYKMGHSTPATHPFHQHLLKVADRIGKESAGRMTLNVFPNSQLGGDNDLLSQVRSGAIEICQPAGLILASILPLTAINGMGFAFESYDKVWPTMDGELGKYVRGQITAKVGLVPMDRIWDLGFRQITNSIKPIKSAADLDGMKLRVPGAPALVSLFKSLGTHPVSMQFGEVYTSLQTKVVDGQENPMSIIDAGKFYEVQKYCSITNHVWDGHWITFNKAAWDRLPDDLKTVVARAFNEGAVAQRAELAKMNDTLQAELEKKGMTFNKAETQSFRDKLNKAGFYKEWREKLGEEVWTLLEKQVGKLG